MFIVHEKNGFQGLSSPFGHEQDLVYMQQALALAKEAYALGEVPIGAIVVDEQGNIIGSGKNSTERFCTQSAHAEIAALTQAGRMHGDWRLTRCWLYVTLEPCFMCMGLVYLSRLSGVVYGAPSPLFGAHLDSSRMVSVYKVDMVSIISGVCAHEAAEMLKDFFKEKRGYNGGN
jgi:tRNA(adenine34) deaminase